MKNLFVLPYKQASESAKALAANLGAKRIRLEGSRFKGSPDKIVINWGCSKVSDEVLKCTILNHPDKVAVAADKLKFFNAVEAFNARQQTQRKVCRTVRFTADKNVVAQWLVDGRTVVARTILNGNSGAGIVLVEPDGVLVDAPLYTLYTPKKSEWRIHVRGGNVADIQRKARREDTPDDQVNWKIRNHDNGFIFARNEDIECPNDVITQAVNCVRALGLDFGAVDVVFNDKQKRAYVLEVNTAPGLAGETLTGYVNSFRRHMENPVPAPAQMPDAVRVILDDMAEQERIVGRPEDVLLVPNPDGPRFW